MKLEFDYKLLSSSLELLPHKYLSVLLQQVIRVLEKEDSSYRPYTSNNRVGGLIDLVKNLPAVPTIIVPDLHGRWQFFQKVLNFVPNYSEYWPESLVNSKLSVGDLLLAQQLNLVCVGDGLHSELHKNRWLEALLEYEEGQVFSKALKEEMTEGLTLMTMVMRCKIAFPQNFHFLKGNHENILNQWNRGDRPFRKFAKEGEMSRRFMEEWYGEDILQLYSSFEGLLPLCVVAPRCLISHSEPQKAYTYQQIVESPEDKEGKVIYGLTWTKNDESQEGAVATMLQDFLPQWWNECEGQTTENDAIIKKNSFSALYFGGHRTIPDRYRLRQGGRYVQFHNPRLEQIALVPVHRSFDLNKDLIQF